MSDTATFNRHVLNALSMQIAVLNSQGLIIALRWVWRPSWGLLDMQERVQAVGGHCAIAALCSNGTTITVEVPL